jgi:hypothetical protein
MELKDFLLGVAVALSLSATIISGLNATRIASANADALTAVEFVRKADPVLKNVVSQLNNTTKQTSMIGDLFVGYASKDNKALLDQMIQESRKAANNAENDGQ